MSFKKIVSFAASLIIASTFVTGISASAEDYPNNYDPVNNLPVRSITLSVKDLAGKAIVQNFTRNDGDKHVGIDYNENDDVETFASFILKDDKNHVLGYFYYAGNGKYICDLENKKNYSRCERFRINKEETYTIEQVEAPDGYIPVQFSFNTYSDSEYLNKKNISIKVSQPKYGDLNMDGSVDVSDLTLMQKTIAGWSMTVTEPNGETLHKVPMLYYFNDISMPTYDFCRKSGISNEKFLRDYEEFYMYGELIADVNRDGKVDLSDLTIMQKYVAGWKVKLGRDSSGEKLYFAGV